MRLRMFQVVVAGLLLSLPLAAYAQEATISGTVTDSTGAVLPGVTVTGVHEASGNNFPTVTDERGAYRLPVRIGTVRLTAELAGFGTMARTVELLVGQQAVINLQLSPSTITESVTVTAEAPLVDTTQSQLGGNIDSKQMQELPVNGRNWQDLVTLAPGNRANSVGEIPTARERRDFQLNMDGQQVTTNLTGGTNPRYSRDAIAEFQFLSSRFDATQGRSSGVQVNAVTKSGTNTPSGSFSGYFRDDKFNAKDFVAGKVLDYSNQQLSATYGGPIIRDRLHYFANYEYEREPLTATFQTPYPSFNIDLLGTNRANIAGLRVDYQISPATRLMVRGNSFDSDNPYQGGGTAVNHPASTALNVVHTKQVYTSLTQVLSNRALNEAKVGWASAWYSNTNYTEWTTHPAAAQGITSGSPRITFRGFAITGNANQPQRLGQDSYSVRDDFTYSFDKGGRHNLKAGGEFIFFDYALLNCRNCMGVIDAQGGPIPANIEALFPVWDDPTTWNLNAISPIVRSYSIGIGNFRYNQKRKVAAAWFQDDWVVSDKLTLNLGLRYDVATGVWANAMEILPWLEKDRPDDFNNIGPRTGFAYSLNQKTVIRGGFGYYFGEVLNNISSFTLSYANTYAIQVLNDGRPDFATNPFNGPIPTYEQAGERLCTTRNVPGCLRPIAATIAPPEGHAHIPYSYQSSIGFQRQVGSTMAFDVDYAFTGARQERYGQGHIPLFNFNLTYDPVTHVNYPFTDIARRPYPEWGTVQMEVMDNRSNYNGLQTAFTKRMSNRWQASGTYTLSWLHDGDPLPFSGLEQVGFEVPADLGGEYGLASSDQRHRAVLNGIWEPGMGFLVSGLYFYGSGQRFITSYGGDVRQTGLANGRYRPDGTIVPRNNLAGETIHRVDMRVSKRVRLGSRFSVDGIFEVFNVFNHANYGTYTTQESSPVYGEPTASTNVAFLPRMLQFGFRTTF